MSKPKKKDIAQALALVVASLSPTAVLNGSHYASFDFTDLTYPGTKVGHVRVYFPHAIEVRYTHPAISGGQMTSKFGSEADAAAFLNALFVDNDAHVAGQVKTIQNLYPVRNPKDDADDASAPTQPTTPVVGAATPGAPLAPKKRGRPKKVVDAATTPTPQPQVPPVIPVIPPTPQPQNTNVAPTANPTPLVTLTLPADVAQSLLQALAAQGVTLQTS